MRLKRVLIFLALFLVVFAGVVNSIGYVGAEVLCSDSSCDDGNVCNGLETCVQGVCQPGTSLVCNNNLFCDGVETCDPQSGCVAGTPVVCGDQNLCTTNSCNEVLDLCQSVAVDCSELDNIMCGFGVCNPETGLCENDLSLDNEGPVTSNLIVTKTINACNIKIEATETDMCSFISQAEYFIGGATCGGPGTGLNLSAVDGNFDDELVEAVLKNNAGNSLQDGSLNVHVRGKDILNNWGACETVNIALDCLPPEYPTCKEGNNVDSERGIALNGQCNPDELLVCDNDPLLTANVCDKQSVIQLAEYFIDKDNPVDFGGINMIASDGNYLDENCEDVEAIINLDPLSEGTHYVQLHGKDSQETWGKLDQPANPLVSFIKDTTPPSTEKLITFADDVYQNCEFSEINGHGLTDGCYYVKPGTNITLSATDPDPQGTNEFAGNVIINWKVWYSNENDCSTATNWTLQSFGTGNVDEDVMITLEQDSCHLIEYWASDGCVNEERHHFELDIVDSLAPVTKKEVGEPKVACELGENGGSENNNHNSTGDLIHSVNFSTLCPGGLGVGIAFDGQNLWYSCHTSGTNLYRANPLTGVVTASYNIPVGALDALSYDATRNAIWAAVPSNSIYRIDLNSSKDVVGTTFIASVADSCSIIDGLAFDARNIADPTDDVFYYSDDCFTTIIAVYNMSGGLVESFSVPPEFGAHNSGLAIGGQLLYEVDLFNNRAVVVDKTTKAVQFNFSTAVSGDPNFHAEDEECDTNTFASQGIHVMWSIEAFEPRRAHAFEIPFQSCQGGGIEQPQEPAQCDWFITQETPINLTCMDQEPHPIDNVTLYWRDFLDGQEAGQWNVEEDGSVVIYKNEDSRHVLEWYCVDALGNSDGTAEEPHMEIDVVDSVPPEITKELFGPWFGQCPPVPQEDSEWQESTENCFIDGVTNISVTATDPEPHPVNDVSCRWGYTVNDGEFIVGGQGLGDHFVVHFSEESEHNLIIECKDALGNRVHDEEVFIVDKTPPVTEKSFEGPQFTCYDWCWEECYSGENGGQNCVDSCLEETCQYSQQFDEWFPMWINSNTWVVLNAQDQDPHPSGVQDTFWRNTIVDDENCRDVELCQEAVGTGEWNTYSEPFHKAEQSCHLIEYFSVDNVNKTEMVNKQCVFVDNTAPETDKEVGELRFACEGNSELCGPEGEWPAWFVTDETPINLTCLDQGPHPVDHESLCFRISWHVSPEECSQNYGEWDEENKWCWLTDKYGNYYGDEDLVDDFYCVNLNDFEDNVFEFKFREESLHNIEWFCQDALENDGELNIEWDNVDLSPPKIIILNPTTQESLKVKMCAQSIVALVEDEKSGVNKVWAELWTNSGEGEKVREVNLTRMPQDTWESLMDKSLPAGNYTLKVCATDNLGNEYCKEILEELVETVFVESISPFQCVINPETGGQCDFTFNVCMRGGNGIQFWMNKLGSILTPGMMGATIINPDTGESAFVGLRHELGLSQEQCEAINGFFDDEGVCWFISDAEFLDLSCEEINGRTEFELHLDLNSNVTGLIGPGIHDLEYWIESSLNEESPLCVDEEPQENNVVINEFLSDPAFDNEWIELYNPTDSNVDLTNWEIHDNTGLRETLSGIISAGDYFVIEFDSSVLNNPGDIIKLIDGSDSLIDSVAYGNWPDGNILDNAPAPEDGESTGRFPNGVDTDVDSADFMIFGSPTKGTANAI